MGTAGHIDHGKTALIKALTDIDCDTHKAEKERGITINLGFAHLDLPSGNSIGIIDVPGHKDFVNTMVAGASSIDFVMLVIAADSGIMPQTIEHLKIIEMLGTKTGFVVLTKIDIVDEELLSIAEEEISEFINGTILENFPIIKTSAKTKEGISELRKFLSEIVSKIEDRKSEEIFRMFIDRIFTKQGLGTIITGSVISGNLSKNDTLYLLPDKKELRIRRMERHGKEVEKISAGDRASMNLVGLKPENFRSGMLLSDRILRKTFMIDAELTLFQHNRKFGIWTQVIFLLGTFQAQAHIHLIDKNKLKGGEKTIVQIHLDNPCIAQYNDRFVIRSSSSDITLGGGKIIDAYPLHHKRRTKKLLKNLHKIIDGGISELVASEVRKCRTAVTDKQIADILNISLEEVQKIISTSLPKNVGVLHSKNTTYLITSDKKVNLQNKIIKQLQAFHKENPLEDGGKTFDELKGILDSKQNSDTKFLLEKIIDELQKTEKLKKVGDTFALKSHNVTLSQKDNKQINCVENLLKNSKMKIPLITDLVSNAEKYEISGNRLKQILQHLVTHKKAYNVGGNYIHSTIVNSCREQLLKYFSKHKNGITVANFRNLVSGNRKICLHLLTQFDNEGISTRYEDFRIITEKGKKLLNEMEKQK